MTLVVAVAVLAVLALGYAFLVLSRRRLKPATGKATKAAAPSRPRDDVRFTVYRPASVEPERWYELLVYAHRAEGPTEDGGWQPDLSPVVHGEAAKLLGEAAPSYRMATEDAAHPVVRDTQFEFVPEIDGFQFNPPRIVLDWTEELHRAHFRMKADAALVGTTARGQLTIFNGPIILAQLALVIRVARSVEEEAPERVVLQPYRRVFASYARTDAEVVRRVAEYARALGDEYLIDVTHIRSGEQWEPRIEQLITQADVFQLFWSWNALASEYVEREWRYALSLGRPNFVRPVYWEEPLPQAPDRGLPPPELRSVHFQRIALAPSPGGATTPPLPSSASRPAPAPRASARSSRVPLAAVAMLVLGLGAIGVFTQLSRVGAPPDGAVIPPAETPPPPPPPTPPPAVPPSVTPVTPRAIVVAAFDAPEGDADLLRRTNVIRDQLVTAWPGDSVTAVPAGRDPLAVARQRGSRWVVTGTLTRAGRDIRIEASVTDVRTGGARRARSVAVPANAPPSEIAAALEEVIREVIGR